MPVYNILHIHVCPANGSGADTLGQNGHSLLSRLLTLGRRFSASLDLTINFATFLLHLQCACNMLYWDRPSRHLTGRCVRSSPNLHRQLTVRSFQIWDCFIRESYCETMSA